MSSKPNQGMRHPQVGGIGSRMDVGRAAQVCRHEEGAWRLGPGYPWRCFVCHPPARPWLVGETCEGRIA